MQLGFFDTSTSIYTRSCKVKHSFVTSISNFHAEILIEKFQLMKISQSFLLVSRLEFLFLSQQTFRISKLPLGDIDSTMTGKASC